jgi:endonuclease G
MPQRELERLVRDAHAHAERVAGSDDAAFERIFHEHLRLGGKGSATRSAARGAVARPGTTGPHSFHIYADPRYLKNSRALARRMTGGARVIGGQPVPAGAFLDCVAVGSDAQWGCTGTLIGPNTVLSAGHCVEVATRVFFGSDVTKPGVVVRVKKRVRHPRYHQGGKRNDLMVLVLERDVADVPPRKLATRSRIEAASDGRVVGFGATEASGTFGYGRKLQVDVPIASPSCRGKVGGEDDSSSYGCDRNLELVAGRSLLARDSCDGDSGGPFYVDDGAGDWLLAGATSRATDSALSNCGDGGIYVRVDRFKTWIRSVPGVKLAS